MTAMISLKKFLDLMEGQGREFGPSQARVLAVALRQAMATLLDGLPLQADSKADGEPRARQALDSLLQRLQGPVKPFDVLDIAGSAISILEQNASDALELRRREAQQVTGTDKQAALVPALIQALSTLLEGWLRHYRAGETEPNLIRAIEKSLERLRGPLEPFNVIEIAGEALTSIEADLRATRDRCSDIEDHLRAAERQADLGSASLRALQFMLDRAPYGRNPGSQTSHSKQIIADLARRLDASPAPEEVIGIVRAAVSAIEEEAAAEILSENASTPPEPPEAMDTVLAERLRTLLLNLPFTNEPDAEPGAGMGTVIAALADSLDGIHNQSQVVDVLDQVIAELERDAHDRAALAGKPDPLSQALLDGMRLLLKDWPGDAMARVVARLKLPLRPEDVTGLADEALALLRESVSAAVGDDHVAGNSEAWLHGFRLLIEGLRPGGPPDIATGHASQAIDALLRRLEQPIEAFDVLEIANEALACVHRAGESARTRHQQYSDELQCIISMLTATVAGFSSQRDVSIERLQRIERQIEQASLIEDLRTLKSNLADCLTEVREAASIQRKQSAETIRAFENQIQSVRSRIPTPREADIDDSATLRAQSRTQPVEYIAVFVLDRENSIAARFGEKARDAALNLVKDRLREALLPADRVVRWKGAAFLASLKRSGTISDVRAELSIAATIPASLLVELGSRSIRLPVSLSWTVFPQAHNGSLDQSFEKVDQFIAKARPGSG